MSVVSSTAQPVWRHRGGRPMTTAARRFGECASLAVAINHLLAGGFPGDEPRVDSAGAAGTAGLSQDDSVRLYRIGPPGSGSQEHRVRPAAICAQNLKNVCSEPSEHVASRRELDVREGHCGAECQVVIPDIEPIGAGPTPFTVMVSRNCGSLGGDLRARSRDGPHCRCECNKV